MHFLTLHLGLMQKDADNSDFLTIHAAFAAWRRCANQGFAHKFCRKNFLSHENLSQIEELRQQLLGLVTCV
jgi:ATP-dependent RNA helicase DHX29